MDATRVPRGRARGGGPAGERRRRPAPARRRRRGRASAGRRGAGWEAGRSAWPGPFGTGITVCAVTCAEGAGGEITNPGGTLVRGCDSGAAVRGLRRSARAGGDGRGRHDRARLRTVDGARDARPPPLREHPRQAGVARHVGRQVRGREVVDALAVDLDRHQADQAGHRLERARHAQQPAPRRRGRRGRRRGARGRTTWPGRRRRGPAADRGSSRPSGRGAAAARGRSRTPPPGRPGRAGRTTPRSTWRARRRAGRAAGRRARRAPRPRTR